MYFCLKPLEFCSALLCVLSVSALSFSATNADAQTKFKGIGRAATLAEIKAWDIDVRPDFKGLPAGRGSVAQGQEVWEAKCESCHGTFGESGEVFTPIAGGITKNSTETGHAESLIDGKTPIRSTLMKVATLSTIWDYVNRAMPWNAPKSLSTDEVYASVAYILHLNDIVPSDFTLSNENIAQVQQKMPNRNGMTTTHGMLSLSGKPDVIATACMQNCAADTAISSSLPDYAKNAHGNLAVQIREIGVRGIVTESKSAFVPAAQISAKELVTKAGCMACHGMDAKIVGPGFAEITKKYSARSDALAYLASKVREGGSGIWGAIPMPPQPQLSDADVRTISRWLAETR